jgi:hypothetical protein
VGTSDTSHDHHHPRRAIKHPTRRVAPGQALRLTTRRSHPTPEWTPWHRFTTLALAAHAILAICAADTGPANDHDQPDLIPLTVNEIRRLINVLLIRPIHTIAHSLRWSQWRRQHQARAKRSHYTRRLTLEFQP